MGRILKQTILQAVVIFILSSGVQTVDARGKENLMMDLNTRVLVTLYALKTATLSAEVPGVVLKIGYDMGQKFKKNDPLVELNSKLFYAEKLKAAAILKYASVAYETNYNLNRQKSVSSVEFAKVKADLEVARANFSISEKKVNACSVRAPYPGRVTRLLVKENEWVEQGQPLVEIVNDKFVQAKFIVPFKFWGHLRIGDPVTVHVKGIDRKVSGEVTHISPVLEPNTATFQVFAKIDNSGNFLRAGMTGEIWLKRTLEKYTRVVP